MIYCQNGHTFTHFEDRRPNLLCLFRVLPRFCSGVSFEHDECERNFAAVIVWDTYDAGIIDLRMIEKMALQLGWGNLEASDFQDFLM